MRKVFIAVLLLISGACFGQVVVPPWTKPNNSYGDVKNRTAVQLVMLFPTGCGNPATLNTADSSMKQSAMYFDSCAHRYWLYDSKLKTWDSLHIGVAIPASLSSLTHYGYEYSLFNVSTRVLNIPRNERSGLYVSIHVLPPRFQPILYGNIILGLGNSRINGAFSSGTPWINQVGTATGKTVVTSAINGGELNTLVSQAYPYGTMGGDTTTFTSIGNAQAFGYITSGAPYAGIYWCDHPNSPQLTKTNAYVYDTWRAFIANHYLNNDWFAASTLTHTGFRTEVAGDSVNSKSGTALKGIGTLSFVKPAGKTSLVVLIYHADSTRVRVGTTSISVAGVTAYSKYGNGLNDANRGNAPVLKVGLNYAVAILKNLPDSAQNVVITCSGSDSSWIDYIGYLKPVQSATRPLFADNVGYGEYFGLGLAIPNIYVDSANLMQQKAFQEFIEYPVFIQNTNAWYDSTTCINGNFHYTASAQDSVTKAWLSNLISQSYAPVNNAAWTTNGTTANYFGGKVGINTIPDSLFHINGSLHNVGNARFDAKIHAPNLAAGSGTKAVRWDATLGLVLTDTTVGGASGITIGTTPITGGADKQVLFNDAGVVQGDAGFTYYKATDDLVIGGSIGIVNGGVLHFGAGPGYLIAAAFNASNFLQIENVGAGYVRFQNVTGGSYYALMNMYQNQGIDINQLKVGGAIAAGANATFEVTPNSAVSKPNSLFLGTWYSGGTSTTTKPHVLIEPIGTTSAAWSTTGTGIGINAASGFTGNIIDAQLNGVSVFNVTGSGIAVAGSFSSGYVAKTSTYTVTASDYTINCTSGTFTVTLPTAVSISGRTYVIKNSGAGTITIATTSSQTIDGVTTKTLNTQYSGYTVQSDGANWIITSTF